MTTIKMTEKELAENGLVVVGDKLENINPDENPDTSWELSKLEAFAGRAYQASCVSQSQSQFLTHKAAVERWWAGKAWSLIRDKKIAEGKGCWEEWVKVNGITRTTVYDAIALSERVTLKNLKNSGLTEALKKFGVIKDREPRSPAPPETEEFTPATIPFKVKAGKPDETTEPEKEPEGQDQEIETESPAEVPPLSLEDLFKMTKRIKGMIRDWLQGYSEEPSPEELKTIQSNLEAVLEYATGEERPE
jgi:hypothetical protein